MDTLYNDTMYSRNRKSTELLTLFRRGHSNFTISSEFLREYLFKKHNRCLPVRNNFVVDFHFQRELMYSYAYTPSERTYSRKFEKHIVLKNFGWGSEKFQVIAVGCRGGNLSYVWSWDVQSSCGYDPLTLFLFGRSCYERPQGLIFDGSLGFSLKG